MMQKEKAILDPINKANIARLDYYFKTNNNYLGLMKKNPDTMNKDAVKFEHPID